MHQTRMARGFDYLIREVADCSNGLTQYESMTLYIPMWIVHWECIAILLKKKRIFDIFYFWRDVVEKKSVVRRLWAMGAENVWTHSLIRWSPVCLGGLVIMTLHPSVHISVTLWKGSPLVVALAPEPLDLSMLRRHKYTKNTPKNITSNVQLWDA